MTSSVIVYKLTNGIAVLLCKPITSGSYRIMIGTREIGLSRLLRLFGHLPFPVLFLNRFSSLPSRRFEAFHATSLRSSAWEATVLIATLVFTKSTSCCVMRRNF